MSSKDTTQSSAPTWPAHPGSWEESVLSWYEQVGRAFKREQRADLDQITTPQDTNQSPVPTPAA
jgi:hypothetical protein